MSKCSDIPPMKGPIPCYYFECVECLNPKVENHQTGLCASCSAAKRKQVRDSKKVKVVKPIKKVSASRAKENAVYERLRKEYLEAYPVCEVVECHRKSSQIHHMQGRTNELLCDVNNFLAVCDVCHQRITVDSKWALDNGYSILRSV